MASVQVMLRLPMGGRRMSIDASRTCCSCAWRAAKAARDAAKQRRFHEAARLWKSKSLAQCQNACRQQKLWPGGDVSQLKERLAKAAGGIRLQVTAPAFRHPFTVLSPSFHCPFAVLSLHFTVRFTFHCPSTAVPLPAGMGAECRAFA